MEHETRSLRRPLLAHVHPPTPFAGLYARPFGMAGGAAAMGGRGHDFASIRVSAERGPAAPRRAGGMPAHAAPFGPAPSAAAPIQRVKRKKQKYGVVINSNQGKLTSVNITGRPGFSTSTRKKLASNPKYAAFHSDPKKGTLKQGYSRNHIQAWMTVKTLLSKSLTGVKHTDVPDKLGATMKKTFGIDYNPGKTTSVEAHIKKAGRAMFNHVENLRVDDATANSSEGSKMKHRLTRFGAEYPNATPTKKPDVWKKAKDEIKQHAIDSSPSGPRKAEAQFGSPMVKMQMGAQIGRTLVETPPSARKKGKRGAQSQGTKILSGLL
jgi:hypothetical protein